MIASDILNMCKMRLRNISKSLNSDYMLMSMNFGISDLSNRFNLLTKSEVVGISLGMPMYSIRDPRCLMLISLYDSNGMELVRTDVLNSREWQWKQINYRSFLLNKPTDCSIIAVYKASPVPLQSENDITDIPEAFSEALILYITYMVSASVQSQASSIGHRGSNESNTYRELYENECNRLIMMGYKINLETERPPVQERGFV